MRTRPSASPSWPPGTWRGRSDVQPALKTASGVGGGFFVSPFDSGAGRGYTAVYGRTAHVASRRPDTERLHQQIRRWSRNQFLHGRCEWNSLCPHEWHGKYHCPQDIQSSHDAERQFGIGTYQWKQSRLLYPNRCNQRDARGWNTHNRILQQECNRLWRSV